MRFVDEFRDPETARRLAREIARVGEAAGRPMRFMEVCGGHTMAIRRFGLPELLPDSVELLSGPGCPVCVTPTTYIDRAIALGDGDGTPMLTTFGDLYRVPGSRESLEDAAARGLDVRIVYSPRDALELARSRRERTVVFLAIGFETTAPAVAGTLMEAADRGIGNFRVMSGHKTMPGVLRALMEAPEVAVDGFILPGHVTTITGTAIYQFLPEEFGAACCVAGFEPNDVLLAVLRLAGQVADDRRYVENAYRRVVAPDGNPLAWAAVQRVMEPADAQWRGLGMVPGSGLELRPEWSAHCTPGPDPAEPSAEFGACRCGEVLRGLIRPPDCALFGGACTPDAPKGPCMVSGEGACAAYFKYGKLR